MIPPSLWQDAWFVASRLRDYPIYSPPHIVEDEYLLPRAKALENFAYFKETRPGRVAAAISLTRDWVQPLPDSIDFAIVRRDIMRFLMRYGVILAYADTLGFVGRKVWIARESLFRCQLRGSKTDIAMVRRLSLLHDIGTMLSDSIIDDAAKRSLPKLTWTIQSSYDVPPNDVDLVPPSDNAPIVERLAPPSPGVDLQYDVFRITEELRRMPDVRNFEPFWRGWHEQIIGKYSALFCDVDEETGEAIPTLDQQSLLKLNSEIEI